MENQKNITKTAHQQKLAERKTHTAKLTIYTRIFNIIHKHLLEENNSNNETIEIRLFIIICTLFINKRTPVFSPCKSFSFLVMLFL